jgi:rhodanese-related sulfurtransferase
VAKTSSNFSSGFGSGARSIALQGALIWLLLGPTPVAVAGPATRPGENAAGPFCGIYDLYAACRLLGKRTTPEDLLKPEYVDVSGSSWLQLKAAAAAQGLHSLGVANLSVSDLQHTKWPTIIHVTSIQGSGDYDHFLLVIPNANRLEVFDPPTEPRIMSPLSVSEIWDHRALVISQQPVRESEVFYEGRMIALICAATLMIAVICLKFSDKGSGIGGGFRASLRSAMVLGASAFVAGILLNVFLADGLLSRASSTFADISAPSSDNSRSAPLTINIHDLQNAVDRDDIVLIDARLPHAFKGGHISGSINIPALSSDSRRHEAMRGVSNSQNIVVYCQNAECPYAGSLYQLLLEDGFTRVRIYEGGWEEWSQMH